MRTTKKEITAPIRNYILNHINPTDYNVEAETDKEKLEFLVSTYIAEYPAKYHLKHSGSYQKMFIDYIQGLPTCFNVDFRYYEIVNVMESWGLPQPEDKTGHESAELFYRLIYREVNALLRKHGMDQI